MDRVVAKMVHQKLKDDAWSKYSTPVLVTNLMDIKKHVGEIYTLNIFDNVQKKMKEMITLIRIDCMEYGDKHVNTLTNLKKLLANWVVIYLFSSVKTPC